MRYPQLMHVPRFLLGHSMGGLISTHVALRDPNYFNGVVLSGAALGSPLSMPPRPVRAVLQFLSRFVPKFVLPQKVNPNAANHNTAVTEFLVQDPHFYGGGMPVRFLVTAMDAQEDVWKKMYQSTFPFLIVFGEDDQLCSVGVARQFYEEALSSDKDMKTYPGAAHEVMTEVCRIQVMDDIVHFFEKRLISNV
ncbi:acylglycerol lipase [Angomonas deanei]|nr:acylglycerol lipase [Angomonas deanei]|eukprot:EPY33415.1 acylglycerol lipase [Angomonas deanei]